MLLFHDCLISMTGITPLLVAVQAEESELVKDLVKAGASVNVGHGATGKSPLHIAAEIGDIVTACCLLAEVIFPL